MIVCLEKKDALYVTYSTSRGGLLNLSLLEQTGHRNGIGFQIKISGVSVIFYIIPSILRAQQSLVLIILF